jgi:chromosome segregation ATPase
MDMDVFEKLEAKIDELMARQAEQARFIENHQTAIAQKEEEIASLKERLEAADQERNQVKARIDGLVAKIDSYAVATGSD